MSNYFFDNYFSLLSSKVKSLDINNMGKTIELIKTLKREKKKIIVAGNGGSAAIASHVSVDFTKAANIRSINFNEADLITCFANDYGYENWLDRAVEAYSDMGDAIILISSSGRSKNIINAAIKANKLGLNLITFSGFDSENELRQLGQINFWVNSKSYNIVEMTHHIWLVAIVDFLVNET